MIIESTPSIYIKPSLNDAVEEWVKAGGVIGGYNSNKLGKDTGEFLISPTDRGGFLDRKEIQQPLLEKYASLSKSKKPWHDLVARLDVQISPSQVRGTFQGRTTLRNLKVWNAVKKEVEKMINELSNN